MLLPAHVAPGGKGCSFLPPSSTFYSSVSLVSKLVAQSSHTVKAGGIYFTSKWCLQLPAATASPVQCYCLAILCDPTQIMFQRKAVLFSRSDRLRKLLLHQHRIEAHRILIQLSTNTALCFIFSVTAALVPSSPTSLLEMSLLIFHLCTCSGPIIQRPANKPFTIHSYSAHKVTFWVSGIGLIPSLLWYGLVFLAGLSRTRSRDKFATES